MPNHSPTFLYFANSKIERQKASAEAMLAHLAAKEYISEIYPDAKPKTNSWLQINKKRIRLQIIILL